MSAESSPAGPARRVGRVVALAGGVGGAKLVHGLAQILPADDLTVIVNTGDDFEHLGLQICPDLDTVLYTLAGLANPDTGWGQRDESWSFLAALGRLGAPTWFALGDRDLATHVERTRRLRAGQTLTDVAQDFARAWGVGVRVLPMSDAPAPTLVDTDEGRLAFQEYFVRRRCEPRVRAVEFGRPRHPSPAVLAALAAADLVIICPSNPFLSVDPILSLPGVRAGLAGRSVVAVTPIVGGQALKGPAAKMLAELKLEVSPVSVAAHYAGLLAGFVLDQVDAGRCEEVEALGTRVRVADTVMRTESDRARLAGEAVDFGLSLRPGAA